MGNCERLVHMIDGSDWLAVDMLMAVEVIQEAQPQHTRKGTYNLERIARRNKQRGKTLKSTRYPHLNEPA